MKSILFRSSYLLFLSLAISFTACKKDDDDKDDVTPSKARPTEYDGSLAAIEDYLGADVYRDLKSMGFNFYEGNEPPKIAGTYQCNSLRVVNTIVPNDPKKNFSVKHIDFTSQNQSKLTVAFKNIETANYISIDEKKARIAGNSEGYFTVLIDNKTKAAEWDIHRFIVISGKKTPAGIEDYQEGLIMIDNGGAHAGYAEPNGKGRVIYESDGLAGNAQ